jgi:multidrug resistance efflux pump
MVFDTDQATVYQIRPQHRNQEVRVRTVLVTFNPHLYDGQLQGLTANLNKARGKLRQLQLQLKRWRQARSEAARLLRWRACTNRSVKSARHNPLSPS